MEHTDLLTPVPRRRSDTALWVRAAISSESSRPKAKLTAVGVSTTTIRLPVRHVPEVQRRLAMRRPRTHARLRWSKQVQLGSNVMKFGRKIKASCKICSRTSYIPTHLVFSDGYLLGMAGLLSQLQPAQESAQRRHSLLKLERAARESISRTA